MTTLPISAGLDDTLAQTPVEDSLPLQQQNRMTTFLVAAVLLVCAMGLIGVRIILKYPGANSTPAWAFLGSSLVISVQVLLAMLRHEFSHRELKAEAIKTRHDIKNDLNRQALVIQEVAEKTNGGLSAAVREVGEQVRTAERDQVIVDAMRHPEFLAEMSKLCNNVADAAADRAARKVRDEMQGQA